MFDKYLTGDLLKYLGIPRDTLRFYEEKGLIAPDKDESNQYRNYDILDIYRLMVIDFYKKRGLSIKQIQALMANSDIAELRAVMLERESSFRAKIMELKQTLARIEESLQYSDRVESALHTFSVGEMPGFQVIGEVSDFVAFREYEDIRQVIRDEDDLFSQLVRYICFDDEGNIGTKILVVDTRRQGPPQKCLYYVAEEWQPSDETVDLMKEMQLKCTAFAAANNLRLTGEAFAKVRCVTFNNSRMRTLIDIYIPFEHDTGSIP